MENQPTTGFLRRRCGDPLLRLLRQGATPSLLAWSLALGAVIGLFPIIGTTTLLCTLAAVGLRLNLVAIQMANSAVYPLQILLLFPFLRTGEWLGGAEPFPLVPSEMVELMQSLGWRSMLELGWSGLHAVFAWSLVALPLALLLAASLRPVLARLRPTG